jgi:type VI secretion system secreted protein VgrG
MSNENAPPSDTLPPARYDLLLEGEPSPWQVRQVDILEELSGDFVAQVEVENDDPTADPAALLEQAATLLITRPGAVLLERRFIGIVRAFEEEVGGGMHGRRFCRLSIEPAFSCSRLEIQWAKHQEVTVPDVLDEVLPRVLRPWGREHDQRLGRLQEPEAATRAYARRDLCVQYDETTHQFARRIMAEEGISYFFDFEGETERLVLVDDNRGFPALPHGTIALRPAAGMVLAEEAVFTFRRSLGAAPDRVMLKTFDPTRHRELTAQSAATTDAPAAVGGEIYDPRPPATLFDFDEASAAYRRSDLELQASLRLERERVPATLCRGSGNVIGFAPGHVFELGTDEPAFARAAGQYVLTAVYHHGQAPERAATAAPAELADYRNEFTCLPVDVAFRPPLIPKPAAIEDYGVVVSESASDPIWTDRHGRVRVRFLADRQQDQPPHLCSPWIPVDQRWAGAGFGHQIIPRAGMLVRIGYQHGDPDRPYVAACRPTALNQLPSPLPEEKTRLTWRTASMRDGGTDLVHGNEITFDDAAGKEEIFVRAGHDYRRKVLNDERTEIDRDERRVVGGNQHLEVKGKRDKRVHQDETICVEKQRTTTVKGDDSRRVHGNDTQTVERDQTIQVHGTRTTTVDKHESGTFRDGRDQTVTGDDVLHVSQTRTVTADVEWRAVQGPTTFSLKDGNAELKAGGAIVLQVRQARLKLDADGKATLEASQRIELTCGQSSIVMTPAKIEIASPELSLTGANGALKLDDRGATTTGLNVSSTAMGTNELTGSIVKAN